MLIDFHTHKLYDDNTYFIRSYMIDEISQIPTHPFTIGLHPWFVSNFELKEALSIIETYCKYENCIAIGEIGIDKTKEYFDNQQKTFLEQLDLAQSIGKPVIIHAVRSYDLLLSIRKQFKLTPWAIHGFYGNKTTAIQLLRKDIYLSFGYKLMQPNPKLLQAFISAPIDKIFLETDTEKIHIKTIYERAQNILNQPVEQQIQQNFSTFTS